MIRRVTLSAAAALSVLALGQPALAATHPAPKVSMTQARAKALRLAPGKVISSEFEKEGGGWRYSFDIQQKTHIQEIGIDAMTGKVVENKSEGKHDRDADHAPAPKK